MIVKTKKYQLDPKLFVSIGYKHVMRKYWWAFLVPLPILLIPIAFPGALWWCIGISLLLYGLYLGFWWVLLSGLPQIEQNKILFDKLMYEISSQNILIKINERQGMPLTWDKVLFVKKEKDAFLVFLSQFQFIHLPFKIFKSEHEIRFLESILSRKNLLKLDEKAPKAAAAESSTK